MKRGTCPKPFRRRKPRWLARKALQRWMDWQQTTLNRASGGAFVQLVRVAPEQRDAAVIEESVRATEPLFALLDAHLADRRAPLYRHTIEAPVAVDKTLADPVTPADTIIYWPN